MLQVCTHCVINSSDNIRSSCIVGSGRGVSSLARRRAATRDDLVGVKDQPDHNLNQHGKVQLAMNCFLFGA